MEVDLWLIDAQSGERIWRTSVEREEPLESSWLSSNPRRNTLTLAALSSVDADDMAAALESLAVNSVDGLVGMLREALQSARGG